MGLDCDAYDMIPSMHLFFEELSCDLPSSSSWLILALDA